MSADLDDELRRLFTQDARLDVSARADADEVVLAGVRRGRRVRAALAMAGGAAAVVGVILVGALLAGFGRGEELPPAESPSVPTGTSTPSSGTSTPLTEDTPQTSSHATSAPGAPPLSRTPGQPDPSARRVTPPSAPTLTTSIGSPPSGTRTESGASRPTDPQRSTPSALSSPQRTVTSNSA
ncbi:hypothetical protein [Streptoalloteichus hindustanus]|uniref:Uncharacterized protein n=1 Tax=Streptoalloteichus hindustanus TaxID=2017 RepID=A0A1M4VCK2_STRHI|nr:hypothetical protein [Streptoalloteichus hindustanus]SHE66701.1 hypothetical protein SAMN05444320_101725 [Streptoalloteichus hindustanus]